MVKHKPHREAPVQSESYGVHTVYHCVCAEIVNAITITFSFFEGMIVGCVVGYFTKDDYKHKEEFADELETGFMYGYKEGHWFSEL